MNIATHLERTATCFPESTAVIEDDRKIPYDAFNRDANRVAGALGQLGLSPGDTVALFAPNSYEWLAFYFGALKMGARAATLSSALTPDEARATLMDCRPKAIFTTDDHLSQLETLKEEMGLEHLVAPAAESGMARLLEMGSPDFSAVYRDRHTPAVILYTGGTTGVSKGVLLSHENLQASYQNVSFSERSTPKDRCLCFLPLNHVFAQVHIMGATVFSGGSIVIQPGFDMDRALAAIGKHHVTKFYSVPTVYIRMLALDHLKERMQSVRYCFSAAASMAAELVREWKTRMGLDIHEAYGMTESASMVTFNHYCRHVVGSVGTPANLVEVQIRGLNGNILGPEEEGENLHSRAQYHESVPQPPGRKWPRRSGMTGFARETSVSWTKKGYLYIVDRFERPGDYGRRKCLSPRSGGNCCTPGPKCRNARCWAFPMRSTASGWWRLSFPKPGQVIDPVQFKAFSQRAPVGFQGAQSLYDRG